MPTATAKGGSCEPEELPDFIQRISTVFAMIRVAVRAHCGTAFGVGFFRVNLDAATFVRRRRTFADPL
jgi:hypothetical protein